MVQCSSITGGPFEREGEGGDVFEFLFFLVKVYDH